MKKIVVIVLASCLTSAIYAAYLDDWSNNDLCGWMDSTSAPEYIQKEVAQREILCYGGVEVASLPTEVNLSLESGTVFPSPDPDLIKQVSPDKDKPYSY
jgi:hypothetical protein